MAHQYAEDDQQGRHDGNRGSNVEELDSKTIQIQNKRFYLDIKENQRGRFLKIAEVTPGGHKNRVTMALHLLPEFRDLLCDFIDAYGKLGPSTIQPDDEDAQNRRPLKTARIMRGQRRYFLDLKENVRGRYLRIRAPGQTTDVPQQVVVLPACGMIDFRDTICGIIDQFGVEQTREETVEEDLPQSATIGSRRSKVFYMDVGKNNRGVYVRMTEQSANYRQSIAVPDRHFRAIGEWFIHAADQLESTGNTGSTSDNDNNDRYNHHNDEYGHGDHHPANRVVNHGANQAGRGMYQNRRRSKDDDEYDNE